MPPRNHKLPREAAHARAASARAGLSAALPAPVKGKVKKVVVTVVLDCEASVPLPSKKAIAAHVGVALRRHDFYTRRFEFQGSTFGGKNETVDTQTGIAVVGSRVRDVDID